MDTFITIAKSGDSIDEIKEKRMERKISLSFFLRAKIFLAISLFNAKPVEVAFKSCCMKPSNLFTLY